MQKILFVTGNAVKFRLAEQVCTTFGVVLEQAVFEAPEIQDDNGKVVARDKARKAFTQFKRPVIISDDSWMIPGLRNFPGPYMKPMNHWFTAEDWLRLTNELTDRRVIVRQIAVYQDADIQKLLYVDVEGVLLREIRGSSSEDPSNTIVSFDGGKSIVAEHHEHGESAIPNRHTTWHELAPWLKEYYEQK